MTHKYSLSEIAIISFILLNVIAISVIPLINLSGIKIYFAQYLFFIFIFLVNFNSYIFSRPILIKLNFFLILGFLVFLFFFVSSFFVNIHYNIQFNSLVKLFSYPIILYLFFFYFPKLIFNNNQLFEKFINFWIIFTTFSSIIAFIMMFLGININPVFKNNTAAFLGHPNTFSFIFTFAIPMVIYKYFNKSYGFGLFITLIFFLMSCLLFTYSRAGYLGVFTTILVITYKKSKYLFLTSVFILIILIFTLFINFALIKSNSSISRTEIAITAYTMILKSGSEKFLWGYGVANSKTVFQNINSSSFGPLRDEQDPHNLILLLGIQFGMLLTLTVIIMILYLLIKVFLLEKRKMAWGSASKVNLSISIVFGLLVQNMLEDIVIYPEYYVMPLFLIFLGYLYNSVYKE